MLSRRCLKNAVIASLALALGLILTIPAGAVSEPVLAYVHQYVARVVGTVTDADGNPLEGVKIVITMVHQDPAFVAVEPVEVVTDEEGSYFARDVRVAWVRITTDLEGYMPADVEVNLKLGANRRDIVLEPAGMLEDELRATEASDAYALGVEAFGAGNHAEAIRYMEQARSRLDDNEENNESLAAIAQNVSGSYLALRKYEEAVVEIREWLRLSPDNPDARVALSQAYNGLGDTDAAAAELEAARATGAQDPESHFNMGVMMIESGDVEGGIAELEMAIQLLPEFPLAHKNLGYAFARTSEYQKAVEHFELYLVQDPDAPDAADVQQFIDALKSMIG